MKKKQILASIFTFSFTFFSILTTLQTNASPITAINIHNMPKTVEEAKELIDRDFSINYSKSELSPIQSQNITGGSFNEKFIKRAITNPQTLLNPLDGMYIVYGDEHDDTRNRPATRTYQGENPAPQEEYRYLGHSLTGANFDNPAFPWLGWGGTPAKDFYFIPKPWTVPLLNQSYNLSTSNSTNHFLQSNQNLQQKLNRSIKAGLHFKYVLLPARETVLGLENSHLKDYSIFWGVESTPNIKNTAIPDPQNFVALNGNYFTRHTNNTQYNWSDFVYILSPPTSFSWGTGFIFMESSNSQSGNLSNVSYMSVPLAPFIATPDYSISVLRTGTEDGYHMNNPHYESIIKISKKNFNKENSTTPHLDIRFNNATIKSINDTPVNTTTSVSTIDGDVTFCPDSFDTWEKSSLDYHIEKMSENSHALAWLSSLEKNYANIDFNTNWRTQNRHIQKYPHPDFNTNVYFDIEEGKLIRYYKVKWKPNKDASLVSISASINLDHNQNPIINEINTSNNFEKIDIPMPVYDFSTKIKSTGAERNNNLASPDWTHNAKIKYSVITPAETIPPPVNILFEVDDNVYINEKLSFTKQMKDEESSTKDHWTLVYTRNIPWEIHANDSSTLISSINLDKNTLPIIPELYLDDNFDLAILDHKIIIPETDIEGKTFSLDYDVLTQDFRYSLNNQDPFVASINRPRSTPSTFHRAISDTTGRFYINVHVKKDILENVRKIGAGRIRTSSNTVRVYPKLDFTLSRKNLGDDPTSGNPLPNFSNPYVEFWLDTKESYIQRRYRRYRITEDGVQSRGTFVRRRYFNPIENLVNSPHALTARVYNGIKLYSSPIFQGEVDTNDENKKRLEWEGTNYKLPVLRAMLNKDSSGNVKSITHVDGQYDRLFLSTSELNVSFSTDKSLAEHFSSDRDASFNNPGNKNNHNYIFSPFATDTVLQNLPYPLRAGYYYIPHSTYTANVRTTIYKRHGEPTEHKDIVNEIIDSFTIDSNLPLHDKDGNNITRIPFSVEKDHKIISNLRLSYDRPPTDPHVYKNASETTLLQNTNSLFRTILEGYSFTDDPRGRSSWQNYKYREYIKHSDIHQIIEKTTITFTLNPRYLKRDNIFYTDINTPNDDYHINVYFNPFSNSLPNTIVYTEDRVDMDTIEINIRENRNFDIHSN